MSLFDRIGQALARTLEEHNIAVAPTLLDVLLPSWDAEPKFLARRCFANPTGGWRTSSDGYQPAEVHFRYVEVHATNEEVVIIQPLAHRVSGGRGHDALGLLRRPAHWAQRGARNFTSAIRPYQGRTLLPGRSSTFFHLSVGAVDRPGPEQATARGILAIS